MSGHLNIHFNNLSNEQVVFLAKLLNRGAACALEDAKAWSDMPDSSVMVDMLSRCAGFGERLALTIDHSRGDGSVLHNESLIMTFNQTALSPA